MKLPIDTAGMMLLCSAEAEPVRDFETKRQKADENGELVYSLQLVALGDDGAEVFTVKVSGEPKGVTKGTPVKVTGLTATTWSMGDRNGISFRAARIEPVSAPSASSRAAS